MAPQSPTTARRRRPFPSPSISKSPDSDPLSRPKRLKQEEVDQGVDGHAPSVTSSVSSASNGRARRKTKEKEKDSTKGAEKDRLPMDEQLPDAAAADLSQVAAEEEENGVTRCICGREDDPDAGEFMVQCETCKVWQHGLCMGYDSEAQLHDDDYYCEQCRPDFHPDFKKGRKKPRQSSTTSHHTTAPHRQSRSHSPSMLKQPSKRRNTMNSRDAAFDQNLKEILETTAAEAGAVPDPALSNGNGHPDVEEDAELGPPNRKKRKRTDDDAPVKKRTRSASSASDRRIASTAPRDESPPPVKVAPAPKGRGGRRGGRKAAVHELVVSIEGEEVPSPAPAKRGHGGRAKGAGAKSRNAAAAPNSMAHDHSTRRNPTQPPNGHPSAAAESSRAYRNSHAYAVSQQPMYTSWGLPDYLAHLEAILPSEVPQPLEVLSVGASTSRAGSLERTQERGVKVKWPSKRMSVGDMNKRVRALVEWVVREQASASERSKRKEALEAALREELTKAAPSAPQVTEGVDGPPAEDTAMALDEPNQRPPDLVIPKFDPTQADLAMKMLEELMEELLRFQERFGAGSKRERR
ncbi:putative histone deacetylase complex subunit cti6 [Favolaschia claudopus]|uniref:Histone deacetylase complex subunit cti6 n=1 Tax=Favolaschia claudopus TaxID=2862362 RepID=A0AAW0DYQ6_9AGAR